MKDDERQLLEEVDFWLRLNNDYLQRHGKAPTRRMQEALFHALDRLRSLEDGRRDDWRAIDELPDTLN
jgi:hypothetical protein